jgi:ParB-like nuclease domain
MEKIRIDLIDPNPNRDFTLYPFDEGHITGLQSSIEEEGFWLGLQVRPSPVKKGRYELAFGHHRLEAAKRAGLKHIMAEILPLTDDEMARRMIVENSTQHGGGNSGALLDSTATIVRRLAHLLFHGDKKTFGKILPNISYEEVKGNFDKNKGIGHSVLLAYAPEGTISVGDIKAALGVLKDSGQYDQIVASVMPESESKEVSVDRKVRPKKFDASVAQIFENPHQLETFRKAVTDEIAQRYIPVEKQAVLAKAIVKKARGPDEKGEVTAKSIRESVNTLVLNGGSLEKKAAKEIPEDDKRAIMKKRMADAIKSVETGHYHVARAFDALKDLLDKGAVIDQRQSGVLDKFFSLVDDLKREVADEYNPVIDV